MSKSRFTAADAAFQYDPSATYEASVFQNLSCKKCQQIAGILNIRNIKTYKKQQLVPIILEKHNAQSSRMIVETQEPERTDTIRGGDDSNVASKALSFNEQLKTKFNEIQKFIFNKVVWFQASSIANFLEYENTNKAIIDHVNAHDKIRFAEIPSRLTNCYPSRNFHPETLFINKYGIFTLISRSKMPLAFEFRRWLVDDVLPSILNTGAYISPEITQTQMSELQEKMNMFEEEKRKFQQEKVDYQAIVQRDTQIRTSIIDRNQIRNLLPLEEIYILTTIEYDRSYLYKIGKSNNTAKRLKSLNTSRLKHNEMYICHVSKCHDANTTENAIHNVLSRYRYEHNREFFQLDFESLKKVVEWGCQCNETFYENCIGLYEQIRYKHYPEVNSQRALPVQCNVVVEDKITKSENNLLNYFNKRER